MIRSKVIILLIKGEKEQQAGEDTRDKNKKTMTGQVATSPEMNPKVDYKY